MFRWNCRQTYGREPDHFIGKARIANKRKFGFLTLRERKRDEHCYLMEWIDENFTCADSPYFTQFVTRYIRKHMLRTCRD